MAMHRPLTPLLAAALLTATALPFQASARNCGCLRQSDACMTEEKINRDLILGMFQDVTEKMSTERISDYFSKDFVLYSNDERLDYDQFQAHLNEAFQTLQSISIRKPVSDLIAQHDRVAARFTCVVTDQKDNAKEFDVIAIFQIKDQRIRRWWELTHPDWKRP